MSSLRILLYVPLFFWVLVAYNLIMLVSEAMVDNPLLFSIPLASEAKQLDIGAADLFLMLGLLFLYFEILKAARATKLTIVDHMLSMVVFIVFLVELIVVTRCGTNTFFWLTIMALLDVVAGFTITISTARRDFSLGGMMTNE